MQAMDHLESFIAECDRRTELAKKRLAETQEEISAEVSAKVPSSPHTFVLRVCVRALVVSDTTHTGKSSSTEALWAPAVLLKCRSGGSYDELAASEGRSSIKHELFSMAIECIGFPPTHAIQC